MQTIVSISLTATGAIIFYYLVLSVFLLAVYGSGQVKGGPEVKTRIKLHVFALMLEPLYFFKRIWLHVEGVRRELRVGK